MKKFNKRSLSRYISRKVFPFFERHLNLHVTAVDYYSPIPCIKDLNPQVFSKIYDDSGIDWNLSGQMDFLHSISSKYSAEYTPSVNTGLTLVDSFILYAIIREAKPRIMIEVGSGETTKISLQALESNEKEGSACQFYAVEPYPQAFLKQISKNNFRLIEKKVEDIDLKFLTSADLLFIDSSHVAKIGSDVNCEILEIVPRLKRGAIVHWHDIMIPTNYWPDWVTKDLKFWNESYMLHAFMLFNETFKIVWASRHMQLHHGEELSRIFPYFDRDRHRCTSFWVQRVK